MHKLAVPVTLEEAKFIKEQLPCEEHHSDGELFLEFQTSGLLFRAQVLVDALRYPSPRPDLELLRSPE